ncbi:hypothetical protein, partial [Neisseria bacilliformis]
MKKLLMVCVLAGLSGCAVLDGSFGKPKAPPKSRQQIIAELNAKYPGCPHIESDSIYDLRPLQNSFFPDSRNLNKDF